MNALGIRWGAGFSGHLLAAGCLIVGCSSAGPAGPGNTGQACVPREEQLAEFGGFAANEVNVAEDSDSCGNNVCLVNAFQGRVTCTYGQAQADSGCRTADGQQAVGVPVPPQLQSRRPQASVYCSCRCDGPDPNAEYCACPDGFACVPLISDLGNSADAGAYCVKDQVAKLDATVCDPETQSCG